MCCGCSTLLGDGLLRIVEVTAHDAKRPPVQLPGQKASNSLGTPPAFAGAFLSFLLGVGFE